MNHNIPLSSIISHSATSHSVASHAARRYRASSAALCALLFAALMLLGACAGAQAEPLSAQGASSGGQTNSDTATATIVANPNYVTFVNVLTPKPGEDQQTIAALLQEGISQSIRFVPGFIAAGVHVSLDNDFVVVYAQWDSEAAVEGAVELIQGGGAPAMAEAFTRATPDFHPYDVAAVIPAPTSSPGDDGDDDGRGDNGDDDE